MAVLVGYASEHGSTRGVAERIATVLRESGQQAELKRLDRGADASRYEVFVLGSAIHNQAWMPEAAEFVRDNAGVLDTKPVWLFSVGTVGDQGSMIASSVASLLRAVSPGSGGVEPKDIAGMREAIHPQGHRAFVGALRPGHYPLVGRVIFRAMGGRYGDHRDWADIDQWVRGIIGSLPRS